MAKGAQKLQIIPLGGLGEIGKNMTVIRVDDEGVAVECGGYVPAAAAAGVGG